MRICLFGSATDRIDRIYIEKTEELCEKLARRGHSLVFGGGNNGVMGAAARGFKKGNAEICGVIPKFFKTERLEAAFTECTRLIETETMNERKQIMEDMAEAFIIAPGGIGTYDEFFEVLTNKQLGRHQKPIVIFNLVGFYEELLTMLNVSINKKFVRENCKKLYFSTDETDRLISYLENAEPTGLKSSDLKDGE